MSVSKPYQPSFFRLSHGLTALLVLGSFITGFLVYDSYDGRFGKLQLTQNVRSLIDIHGTFGFLLFFIFIIFAIYSLRAGRKRLIQADSFKKLTLIHQPGWWYTLNRVTNTLILTAATFSVISGKFQDENWLPQGEVNHVWYFIHLIAWLILGIAITLHFLMVAKVGGMPLILSMVSFKFKTQDHPRLWVEKVRNWFRHPSV